MEAALICCLISDRMYYYSIHIADGSYREGDIRLVEGAHNWEGRVEIFWSGSWGTISDSSWTESDATVVCKQLQHSFGKGMHC